MLGPSLSSGNDAVRAIIDLSIVNSTVQQALELVAESNLTLSQVTTAANMLMAENISSQANSLLNASEAHFRTLVALNNTLSGIYRSSLPHALHLLKM